MKSITAQQMYDWRDTLQFCSGNELAKFFDQQVGDMAPAGAEKLSAYQCREFIKTSADQAVSVAPSLRGWRSEVARVTRA